MGLWKYFEPPGLHEIYRWSPGCGGKQESTFFLTGVKTYLGNAFCTAFQNLFKTYLGCIFDSRCSAWAQADLFGRRGLRPAACGALVRRLRARALDVVGGAAR